MVSGNYRHGWLTQQSIIFTTVPGVEYTFYHSNDLASWTEVGKTYGLGQEFAAAMRETAPAPPPPDPQNPPAIPEPLVSASISIARSSDTVGGTVVSWPSLDHGNAVRHLITATMATEWDIIPIFAESQGSHWFAISPSATSVAPPAANGFLGQKDAAMIADLEAGFASFNQAVTSSVITAHNTPPPPPPAPDSKGFWRIKADWSLDSDNDGSRDHAEFLLAATQGAAADGLIGNAFNADSNADGIPDGEQLDFDGDGTPDAKDVDPDREEIGYKKISLPRYAVFPIVNNLQSDPPYQINDRGEVLFTQSVWRNGDAIGINGLIGTNRYDTLAFSINNHGTIIGQIDSTEEPKSIRYWTDAEAAPTRVESGNYKAAAMTGDPAYSIPSYGGPRLTDDGYFLAAGVALDSENKWPSTYNLLWRLPGNGQPASITAASPNMEYISAPDLMWGDPTSFENDFITSNILIGGQLHERIEEPLKLIRQTSLPKGDSILATGYGLFSPGQFYYDGKWIDAGLYADALDVADDGTAIGTTPIDPPSPIPSLILNGKPTALTKAAPDLPNAWHFPGYFADISNAGWILYHSFTNSSSAAMLPIRLEGIVATGGFKEATGVDDTSLAANNNDHKAGDKLWVMAPEGGGSTSVIFDAPLNPVSRLGIESAAITFDGAQSIELDQKRTLVQIAAQAGSPSGWESSPVLENGNATSISAPIAFKVMKKRIVRVAVYKIVKVTPGEADDPPDLVPTKAALEAYLDKVYGPQVNATFDVTLVAVDIPVQWDKPPLNGFLDMTNDDVNLEDPLSLEQETVRGAVSQGSHKPTGANTPHIEVFLMGGPKVIGGNANGVSNRASNTAWISSVAKGNNTMESTPRTIAHEIGHLICDYGHPDDEESSGGSARLRGTDHTRRLMVSGAGKGPNPGVLLVKGEWDDAEEWFYDNIDSENP